MMYRSMYYSPMAWIPMVLGICFWVLVISLIISLIKHANRRETGEEMIEEGHNERYLHIVKERYAKGEINKDKYEELKKEFSRSKGEESKKE